MLKAMRINSMDLKIDLERVKKGFHETGIFVRAQDKDGSWHTTDIAHLDSKSLITWLRSRGGKNEWAEETVGILLGHGHGITDHAIPNPPPVGSKKKWCGKCGSTISEPGPCPTCKDNG